MADEIKYLSYDGLKYFWKDKLKPIIDANEKVVAESILDINNRLDSHTHDYLPLTGGNINGNLSISPSEILGGITGKYQFSVNEIISGNGESSDTPQHELKLNYIHKNSEGIDENTPILVADSSMIKFNTTIGVLSSIIPTGQYINIGDAGNRFYSVYTDIVSSGENTSLNFWVGSNHFAKFEYYNDGKKFITPIDNNLIIGKSTQPVAQIYANNINIATGGKLTGDVTGNVHGTASYAHGLTENGKPTWTVDKNDHLVYITVGGQKSEKLDLNSVVDDNAYSIDVLRATGNTNAPAKRPIIHTLNDEPGTQSNKIIKSRLSKSDTVDELFYEVNQKYLGANNIKTNNVLLNPSSDTSTHFTDFNAPWGSWFIKSNPINGNAGNLSLKYFGGVDYLNVLGKNILDITVSNYFDDAYIIPSTTPIVNLGNDTNKFGTIYCTDIKCDNKIINVQTRTKTSSPALNTNNYITLTNEDGDVLYKNTGLTYTTTGELKVSGKTTIDDNAVLERNKLYFNDYGSYVGTEDHRISKGYFDRIELDTLRGYDVGIKCNEWATDLDTGAGYIKQVHNINFSGNIVYNDNNEVEGVNLVVPGKIESEGLLVNSVIDISKKSTEIIDPKWPDWPQYVDYGHISVNGDGADIVINNKSVKNVQADWNTNNTDDDSFIQNKPSSLPNPNPLIIQGNGTQIGSNYDGSATTTVSITPENIGAAPTGHVHTKSQITDFPNSLPASDVHDWAKAVTKPTYTASEVGAAESSHTHTQYAPTSHAHDYLPLSGGTLEAAKDTLLALNTTRTGTDIEAGIRFELNTAAKGWVGYTNGRGTCLFNHSGSNELRIADNGKGFINDYEIIHAGGGTMTGQLIFNHEYGITQKSGRIKENGGGWAFNVINWKDNSDTLKANIGVHGQNTTLEFLYLGHNGYTGNNLRVYADGRVRATTFEKIDGTEVSYSGHTHNNATTTTAGFMSSTDKAKLDGIATGAIKYTHPAEHPASMITGLSTVATTGSYTDLLNKPNASSIGAVSGPGTSVSGNIAAFNSDKGKSIYDTGLKLSNVATSGHKHTTVKLNSVSNYNFYPVVFTNATTATTDGSLYIDTSAGTSSTSDGMRYYSYYKRCYCSGGFYEASDERLKNFGDDIKVDLDKLSKLSKKYFTWKNHESDAQQIGVSAQEVQELYPEIVSVIDEAGHLSVSYDKLSVVALKGIDILNDKVKSLEERLNKLEEKLNIVE